MSTVIDRRIAERRRTVAEAKARRRLRWTVVLLIVVVIVAIGYWLVQSPLLAVDRITVTGASRSEPLGVLDAEGIATGMPTVSVRAGQIESALEEEPWIADASVGVVWPGEIAVTVVEHEGAGWIRGARSWLLVSRAGTVLETADAAPADVPTADVAPISAEVGDLVTEPAVFGFIEFVEQLPDQVAAGLVITGDGSELFATVPGHRIRLGTSDDMAAKAATLAALLDSGLPTGASIDLISPIRPAIVLPNVEPVDEANSVAITEAQPEGESGGEG